MSGVFSGCQIVLDLTTSVKFKEKAKLRKSITDNGGIVSYIVTKKSTHVVCNDAEKADISYKVKMATKYSIPVISVAYIEKCVEGGKLLNTDDYLMVGKTKSQELGSGKISASRYQKKEKKKQMKPLFNINSYKLWKGGEKNCPGYSKEFQVAKFAMFQAQKKEKNKKYTVFTVLEVHAANHLENVDSSDTFMFRVMSHSGCLQSVEQGGKGLVEYRFCSTSEEALFLYSHMYNEKLQAPYSMDHVHDLFSRHIGSENFQQMMSELGLEAETVSPPVGELVEHVWREAMGELESIISVPVTSVKSEQVEKAEAVLKQIKEALDNNNTTSELVTEFYTLIPHNKEHRVTSPNKAWLSRKQDLCQLIKDMVSVNEATDWSTRSGTQSRYKALRCTIEHVASTDGLYKALKNKFLSSLFAVSREQDSSFEIQNIYAVRRPVETSNFTHEIDNKQLLYHSSKVENFVGILSRGLMLPKVVVDDHGGTRSDPGMLGSGIYFASDPKTSVAYSTASKTKGTRLMLINEVALGNCLDKTEKDLTLSCAPEGYQSVHGVKATEEQPSDFKNDEYVVYRTEQQRIKYLVEFTVSDDTIQELEGLDDLGMAVMEDFESVSQEIDLQDVKNVVDPMSKVKPGLVCGDTPVDLKGVHIRAKMLDMASEVVVLQEYHNNSSETLEAKYVFPLGDMAAVCGFEAFINGKHIVGEVKEKETAHKEYKKAVSEGHGAYLMDQDEETPDVFTVSVGNLPPGASVLIKITYVAELQVEGELISFRLPGSVAPWKRDTAMKDVTQHDTDTVEVRQGETTVQITIAMPFDIRSIECPTNKVRIKKTLSKATVELLPNQSIEDGFQLLVGLAEIHVPRMWVEKKIGDENHQACMLSFYPEFEACEDDNVEVVFLLDLSNSMKGDNLRDAKKVLLLLLQHLPVQWNFNVVVFGTAFKELFPSCVLKNQSNLKKATEFIKGLTATMGNTEVIRPMHTFYLLRHESSIQNVFLISDGHINNEEAMLSNAMKHSQHTRIFTMGVSSTANRHLLRALARVGAGAYEFFDSKVKSKWESKVLAHIGKAAQPGLTSVSVDWEQHGADVPIPVQAPRQITALFSGSRQVVYGYVPNCLMATLKANIAGHEVSTVVSTSDLNTTEGKILHRLTARAIISDWEDGVLSPDRTDHEIVKMNTKQYIIELSKEYSIVTQFTSFVAIEKREKDETVAEDAPTMEELVEKEDVDELAYMGFERRKESICSVPSERSTEESPEEGTSEEEISEDYSTYSLEEWEAEEVSLSVDFGKDAEEEQTPEESIRRLRDTEELLLKKSDFLEKKVESELAAVKKHETKDKKAALIAIKRKKRYEEQLRQIDGTLATIEFQREALENASTNTEVLRAVSSAAIALKPANASMEVDDVHDVMEYTEDVQQEEIDMQLLPEDLCAFSGIDKDICEAKPHVVGIHWNCLGEPIPRTIAVEDRSFSMEEMYEAIPDAADKEEEIYDDYEMVQMYDEPRIISIYCAVPELSPLPLYPPRKDRGGPPPLPTRKDGPPPPPPPPPPPVRTGAESEKVKAGRSTLLMENIYMGTHVGYAPPEKEYESTHIEERQKFLFRRKYEYAPTEKKGDDLMDDLFRQPKTREDSKKEDEVRYGAEDVSEDDWSSDEGKDYEAPPSPEIIASNMLFDEAYAFEPSRRRMEAVSMKPSISSAKAEVIIGGLAEESEESEEDMGFGLFGDEELVLEKSARFEKKKTPQALPSKQIHGGPPPPPPLPPAKAPPAPQIRSPQWLSHGQTTSLHAAAKVPIPPPVSSGKLKKNAPRKMAEPVRETKAARPEFKALSTRITRDTVPTKALTQTLQAAPPPPPPPPPQAPLTTSFFSAPPPPPLPQAPLRDLFSGPQPKAKIGFAAPAAPAPPFALMSLDFFSKELPPRGGSVPSPPDAPSLPCAPSPPPFKFDLNCSLNSLSSCMSSSRETEENPPSPVLRGVIVGMEQKSSSPPMPAKSSSIKSKSVATSQVSWRVCESREMGEKAVHRMKKKAALKPLEQEESEAQMLVKEKLGERRTRTFKQKELKPLLLGDESHEEMHIKSELLLKFPENQKYVHPKTLDEYGIGVHIPSILCGVPALSVTTLDKLFELQDKGSGSWTMTAKLEKLIGIKFSVCRKLLIEAGIASLGKKVLEQVLSLLSTLIALFSVLKMLRPELFPCDFSNPQVNFAVVFEGLTSLQKLETSELVSFVEQCMKAMTFCMAVDKEHPLIYSTLELGHSWEEVVAVMLEMHKGQASFAQLKKTPAWAMWDKCSFTDLQKQLIPTV